MDRSTIQRIRIVRAEISRPSEALNEMAVKLSLLEVNGAAAD